jgi:hypothetical protein
MVAWLIHDILLLGLFTTFYCSMIFSSKCRQIMTTTGLASQSIALGIGKKSTASWSTARTIPSLFLSSCHTKICFPKKLSATSLVSSGLGSCTSGGSVSGVILAIPQSSKHRQDHGIGREHSTLNGLSIQLMFANAHVLCVPLQGHIGFMQETFFLELVTLGAPTFFSRRSQNGARFECHQACAEHSPSERSPALQGSNTNVSPSSQYQGLKVFFLRYF